MMSGDEESTPSVMGIPKQRKVPSKRVRPKTAGPMGNGGNRCTSKEEIHDKCGDDNLTQKRSSGNKNIERKAKTEEKRVRSTSALRR
jgi:hypothetical protein